MRPFFKKELFNTKVIWGLAILFYILWQGYAFFYGERVLVGNGFGWDGVRYAAWVSDFSFIDYFQHQLSLYYIQRILPSMTVHYLMILLHLDLNNPFAIINTFLALNNFLVFLTMLGLLSLARFLKWSAEATFIAFTSLFFNFMILKAMSYCGISTDYMAFTLGFFQIYFYIKGKITPIYFLSLLGAFVWPTLLVSGLLLTIFTPRFFQEIQKNTLSGILKEKNTSRVCTYLLFLSLILLALIYLGYSMLTILSRHHAFFEKILVSKTLNYFPHISALFLPSIFIVTLYVFYILIPVLKAFLKTIKNNLLRFHFLTKLLIAIICYVGMSLFFVHYSISTPGPVASQVFIFAYSIAAPAKFIVTYFAYFGLGAVLFILLYPKLNFTQKDVLCFPYFLLLLVFALQVHSRFGTIYFPLLAIILGNYLSRYKISSQFCLVYGLLAVFFSYVWVPLNWPGQSTDPSTLDLYKWPWQVFFAPLGLWTTNFSYMIELGLFIIAVIILIRLLKMENEEKNV